MFDGHAEKVREMQEEVSYSIGVDFSLLELSLRIPPCLEIAHNDLAIQEAHLLPVCFIELQGS